MTRLRDGRFSADTPLAERLAANVVETGDCLTWTRHRDKQGYPRLTYQGEAQLAHRLSYELNVGPIPEHLQVIHTCDNLACINPRHLSVATRSEVRALVARHRAPVDTRAGERFDSRYVRDGDGCWNWTGATTTDGYATFSIAGRTTYGHRYSYARFRGPIPDGLVLDHLCRNRRCVNPEHLEAVSNAENVRRGASSRR